MFCHGCGQRALSKGVVIGRDEARGCGQRCGHMLGLSAWSLGVVKGCCQTLWIKGVVMCVVIGCGHWPCPRVWSHVWSCASISLAFSLVFY